MEIDEELNSQLIALILFKRKKQKKTRQSGVHGAHKTHR